MLGGAWADAMDRRVLLIIASCGRAVASLLLWLQAALAVDDVGPLLAGLLLNWVNLSTLYLIDALSCLPPIVATFRLAPMPVTEALNSRSSADGSPRWGFGAVLAGFRYLGGNTVVLMSFVVDLIAMILGSAGIPGARRRRGGDDRHVSRSGRRRRLGRRRGAGRCTRRADLRPLPPC